MQETFTKGKRTKTQPMTPPAVKCTHCDFEIAWETYNELPPVSVFLRSFLDARKHYLNTGHCVIAVEIFINAEPTGGILFELDMYKRFSLNTAGRFSNFYRSLEQQYHLQQFLQQTESLITNL